MLGRREKEHIRELASQIEEAAEQDEAIVQRYKDINALKVVKPTVAIYPPANAIKILIPEKELAMKPGIFRDLEYTFRLNLLQRRLFDADMPNIRTLYSGLCAHTTEWTEEYKTVRATVDGHSAAFEPCILEYGDIHKLKQPELVVDFEKTQEQYEMVQDALGDILDVQPGSPFMCTHGWGESMIDQFVEMRGLEQFYIDMIDAPQFVHEVMRLMTDMKLRLLDQYREMGAFTLNHQSRTGAASYTFTDELPGNDYVPAHVVEKNMWGFAQAQELSGVSPEMLEEFVLPYQAEMLNRFGLSAYGCCEPMDIKIASVERFIDNMRIFFISPYTNQRLAAEISKGRHVLALKLHAELFSHFEEARAEVYLKDVLKSTNGCPVTLTFGEIMEYGKDENVFGRAVRVAKRAVDDYWRN
jgi:hypothetical protein